MTPPDVPVALDELLAHREWVRELTRALTRDVHDAADVEQATWLAAVRRPPVHRESLRGWLATTVRRAAGKLRRSRARRRAAEDRLAAAAAGAAAEDVAALAERADLHGRVVRAVVTLAEPTRGTILLRYFEGLPVAEVAARTGVPLETARARLRRGIAQLRERMDEECGGRDAWFGAAALLAETNRPGTGGAVAAGSAGGGVMAAKTWSILTGLLLVGGAAAWVATRTPERDAATVPAAPPATVPSAQQARPEPPRAERPVAPPAEASRAAEEKTAPPEEPPPPAPAAPPSRSVAERLDGTMVTVAWEQGTILRALGEVASKADVEIRVPRSVATGTPKKLSLTLEQTPARQVLRMLAMVDGGEVRVESGFVAFVPQGSGPTADLDLVPVPRATELERQTGVVWVVDASGAPVAGARLVSAIDGAELAVTDAAGRATVTAVPPLPRVRTLAAGHVDAPVVALRGTGEVRVTMSGRAVRLKLRCTDAGGRPAPGAAVLVRPATGPASDDSGAHPGKTATDGTWEDPSCWPGPVHVIVRADGHATFRREVAGRAGDALDVDAQLRPEAVVEGIVRDAAGAPVAGATILAWPALEGAGAAGRPEEGAGSGQDGRFVLGHLTAGTWRVVAEHAGRRAKECVVEVREAERRTADFELPSKRGE